MNYALGTTIFIPLYRHFLENMMELQDINSEKLIF